MTAIDYPSRSWKKVASHGAWTGFRMTLLYAGTFTMYAVIRAILDLYMLPVPDSGRAGTMLATAASLITAALAITLILLPLSVLAGMGTSLLLHLVLPRTSSHFSIIGVLAISLVVAFIVADTVQLILLPAAGFRPLELPLATWLFWFGLPTVLYLVATGFEGRWLRSGNGRQSAQYSEEGALH